MVYNWYINGVMNIVHKMPLIPVDKEKSIKKFFMFQYYILTKLIAILLLNLLFNTFIEALYLTIFFMLIRGFAQGIHAKKNYQCWIITLSVFILTPLLIKYLVIHRLIIYLSYPIMIINYILFAPNDTMKRPMNNNIKRISFKIIGSIIAISYYTYSILYNNHIIVDSMFYASLITLISFHPLTYKLFRQPSYNYNNRKENES